MNLKLKVLMEKKMHNLKVEDYVLFGGLAEDSATGGNLSDSSGDYT